MLIYYNEFRLAKCGNSEDFLKIIIIYSYSILEIKVTKRRHFYKMSHKGFP